MAWVRVPCVGEVQAAVSFESKKPLVAEVAQSPGKGSPDEKPADKEEACLEVQWYQARFGSTSSTHVGHT